jgi:ParB/RepB/Spo0J family partition protein
MSTAVKSATRNTKPPANPPTKAELKALTKAEQPVVIEARSTGKIPNVMAEQELPIDSIFITHNDRTEFDPKAIETLATSIRERGLDNAITVRVATTGSPQPFELIAGERRLRAMKFLKAKVVRARILQADDKSADLLRLEENLLREDLNPMERAAGIKRFIERHGESQATVGKRFGMTQAQVSNLVRLLALPRFWQDEISAGRVGHTMIRDTVLKWIHRPQVLDHVQKSYEESPAPHELADFERWCEMAARECSRSLSFHGYSDYSQFNAKDCCFKYEPDKHKALDVEEVYGQKRAFNVDEWEAVNVPARKKLKEKQQKFIDQRNAAMGKKPTGGKKKEKAQAAACDEHKLRDALTLLWLKSLAEKLNAKKHRQQIPRLAFVVALDPDAHMELIEGLFQKRCHEVKTMDLITNASAGTDAEFAAWLCAGLKVALPKMEWSFNRTPADVLELANMVGLNLMDDFKPDAAVLAAYSHEQLVAFAHDNEVEWDQETGPLIDAVIKSWPPGYAPQEVQQIAKGVQS